MPEVDRSALRGSRNVNLISRLDVPGGGQVWVDGTNLYIGHMRPPHGTTVVDIADPRNPRVLHHIPIPEGWHSHKVRVADGLMLVNHEKFGPGNEDFGGGLAIYDVARPAEPRLITKVRMGGKGVHRFTFDGTLAYISATDDGYVGHFPAILDLSDPATPREIMRWWIPGQHAAAGEVERMPEGWPFPRCHHPMRLGDRLYVSYWHHGMWTLDISDLSNPRPVAHVNTSTAFPHPTHTCMPVPDPVKGRRILIVADEDVAKLYPAPPAFLWFYDITDETNPTVISTFQVPGLDLDGSTQPAMTGCHQPSEVFRGTVLPCAWFACGLRIVDFADPFAPKEVGHFVPDPAPGADRASSNDVTLDDRGLIYLVDRVAGVHILESPLVR
ncbi:LVIVD repeat-containing protein [Roseomonas sp. CCTCC AB2023176]|uniref:LVIVD repeat-containing protein n=1 Tax=Roseomonas sp. CCTCC AB2023176 TaxID=3342640 RepID=UPI0035DF61A9